MQSNIKSQLSFQDDRSYSSHMARPRRSEQTREDLINAGIEQLSLHGYHGTGIKQILDQVNVPKGSFYNFFASKEAFVAELIDHYSQGLLAQLNEFLMATDGKLSPIEQLRRIYQVSLEHFAQSQCQKSCLIGAMAVELGSESELCQRALMASVKQWIAIYTQIIDRAQQQGEVRADITPQQLATLYWSAWEGTLLKMKLSADLDAAAQTMELMLSSLLTPQAVNQ